MVANLPQSSLVFPCHVVYLPIVIPRSIIRLHIWIHYHFLSAKIAVKYQTIQTSRQKKTAQYYTSFISSFRIQIIRVKQHSAKATLRRRLGWIEIHFIIVTAFKRELVFYAKTRQLQNNKIEWYIWIARIFMYSFYK